MSDERLADDAARWLAAEHALGVTEGSARVEAERRMERDRAFRSAVETWHAQLEPFLDEVEPTPPPGRVWRAIERELAAPSVEGPAQRRRIEPWRALALLGTGAALGAGLVAAALLGVPETVAPPPAGRDGGPVLVATLLPSGDAPAAMARLDPAAGALVVHVALPEETARVPELWLVPGDGVPRSLGVIEGGGADGLRVPLDRLDGVTPAPGDALALSLEPPGGSPTGAPTGPVIASGPLVEL